MVDIYRKFAKYGHQCFMDGKKDVIWKKYPKNNLYSKFLRALFRFITVSDSIVYEIKTSLLRSHAAIQNEKKRHLNEYKSIIHPYSIASQLWMIIMVIMHNIYFWTLPFQIFVLKDKTYIFEKYYIYIFLIFSWMDVIVTFNIGFITSTQQIILNRYKISKHYIQTFFIFDVILYVALIIPDIYQKFDLENSDLVFRVTRMVFVFKYLCLTLNNDYKSNAIFQTFYEGSSVNVFFMVYIYLIFIHSVICACYILHKHYETYYSLRIPTYNPFTKTWELKQIPDENIGMLYVYFWYIALVMITKRGNLNEYQEFSTFSYFTSIVWILSEIIYLIYIVSLIKYFRGLTSSQSKYTRMIDQVHQYIRHKQYPKGFDKRISEYYDYKYQRRYFREDEIIHLISGQLRQEIIFHTCRHLVEGVEIFRDLSLPILIRIISCLKSEIFLANDIVILVNTPGDIMYFIAHGTVAIFAANGKEICHLSDGDHFGEIALIMDDGKRSASVVAVENCELYKLRRKDFMRAILPYPQIVERIERIASERMFENTRILETEDEEM